MTHFSVFAAHHLHSFTTLILLDALFCAAKSHAGKRASLSIKSSQSCARLVNDGFKPTVFSQKYKSLAVAKVPDGL